MSVRTVRIVATAAVVAAILVATLLIVAPGRRPAGLTAPASIDGMALMRGPGVDALADQMRVRTGPAMRETLVGTYGSGPVPAFVLLLRRSAPGALAGFESAYVQGLSPGGGPAAVVRRTHDGVGYECGTLRSETTTPLTVCLFDDGRAIGAGLVPDSVSIDRALQLTSDGRREAEAGTPE